MPVYNGERYLKRSIESIINQPNKDFELVIINDGSIDDSVEIIKGYVNNYSSITLIDIENHGVNYARNLGIKTAKGKYLCFIDQDDFIFSNTLNDELINKLNNAYDNNVDFYSMKNIISNETCNRFFEQEVKVRSEGFNNGVKHLFGISTVNPLFSFYNSKTFNKYDLSIFEKYRNTDTDMQLFHLFYYYSRNYVFDNDLKFYCWVNNLQSVSHDVSRLNKSHYDTLSCWREIAEIHRENHKDNDAMKYCIANLCGVYYFYLLNCFSSIKSFVRKNKVIAEFNDYVYQNYSKYAWGKPKKELDYYFRHEKIFISKCFMNSLKTTIGQRIKKSIPFIRNKYEKKKFPMIVEQL